MEWTSKYIPLFYMYVIIIHNIIPIAVLLIFAYLTGRSCLVVREGKVQLQKIVRS